MIRVEVGDLLSSDVGALVRPVNAHLDPICAVGLRIEDAVGSEVSERIQQMGDFPVGGAFITPAGELSARFIIHVVVQSPEEPTTGDGVRRALVNGCRRAEEWGIQSLALPLIGATPGGLDPLEAASFMIAALNEGQAPADVRLIVASEFEREACERALAEADDVGVGEDDE